jgi:hypothetical protein
VCVCVCVFRRAIKKVMHLVPIQSQRGVALRVILTVLRCVFMLMSTPNAILFNKQSCYV